MKLLIESVTFDEIQEKSSSGSVKEFLSFEFKYLRKGILMKLFQYHVALSLEKPLAIGSLGSVRLKLRG